jgi:hypothetical protein
VSTGSTADTNITVHASYPGQAGIAPSSGNASVPISLRATDIAMDCSSAGHMDGEADAGAPITCSLTVTDLYDPSGYTPDGTVSATAGSDTEDCTLNPSIKSCSVVFASGLPAGSATITSTYGGDGTEFAGSNASDPMTVT